MPCVLPVISLKLFGLLNVRERDPMAIFRHNLVYTAGVLFTFAILGVMVVGLQYAGKSVGWGFHLQSPHFIIVMVIILLVLTLNLFGLFEFKTPGGKVLGDFNPRRGLSGDFLSGVLATALSTPCSAPFLGTALTFAFLSSPWILFLIFFFVGLGLSFPFLLTAFIPHIIYKLPRPGAWMEHCKKFFGSYPVAVYCLAVGCFGEPWPIRAILWPKSMLRWRLYFLLFIFKKLSVKNWLGGRLFLPFPLEFLCRC